jgi:hypothetical protein
MEPLNPGFNFSGFVHFDTALLLDVSKDQNGALKHK